MEMWEKLLGVLQEILVLYQELLRVGQEKKEALVAVRGADLEKMTSQEELLLFKVGKLEKRRVEAVREIAEYYKQEKETLSLAAVRKLATDDIANRLEFLQQELGKVVGELVPLNKLNGELIQQALLLINYNLNLLTQNSIGSVYAARGKAVEQQAGKTMFDSKA